MRPDQKYIARLKLAIRAEHGCGSRHFTTVPVTEMARGKVAWEGQVEVFDLIKHPTAATCYAWSYEQGGARHTTAILGLAPVTSAEMAVKAALRTPAQGK
jgi:hypothetical protein